jgi:hypothetical protein
MDTLFVVVLCVVLYFAVGLTVARVLQLVLEWRRAFSWHYDKPTIAGAILLWPVALVYVVIYILGASLLALYLKIFERDK